MRERSDSQLVQETVTRDYVSWTQSCTTGPTNTSSSQDYIVNSLAHSRSMNDVVIPGFTRKSAQGQIFNNPMVQNSVMTLDEPCAYNKNHSHRQWTCSPAKYIYWGGTYSGFVNAASFCSSRLQAVPSLDAASIEEEAVNKAWSNIDLSQVEGLVTLIEGEKTISELVKLYTLFVKWLRACRKHQVLRDMKRIRWKDFQEGWMTLRYGLRPLFFDLMGIINALNTALKVDHDRQTFRAQAVAEADSSSTEHETLVSGGYYYRDYTKTAKRQITARAGVLTKIEAISALSVWGLDQPLEALWELTPYSFIVDWFFNVGETIAAWTPDVGVSPLASWVVIENVATQITYLTGSGATGCTQTGQCLANTFSIGPAKYSVITTTKERIPSPHRSILPKFRLRLDAAKLLDLVIIGRKLWF